MKTSCNLSLLAAVLLLTVPVRAAEAPPARPPLAIVVVENLHDHRFGAPSAFTDFDRLDLAFQEVARERKWPVRIAAERFAANTATRETELRIFNQPLREVTLGDLTFRGWMTLTVQGVKHDFGIVTFSYYCRPGESTDDALDKVFRGVARAAADRIEPLLFPRSGVPKS